MSMLMKPENNCIVVKSNRLIEANYRLNLTEQRIIFALCSQISRTDKDFREYKFRVSDFMELIEVKDKSKYEVIPRVCGELMKRILRIADGDRILIVSWLSSAEYRKGTGEITLCFDPKLKPYLLQLKEGFTQLNAKEFYQLRSTYAQRIYELLKQYERIGERTFRIDELREKLGIPDDEYKLYSDFKRKVIIVSQKELKKSTHLLFDFEEVKSGKRVSFLKFIIHSNAQNKEQAEDYSSLAYISEIKTEFKKLYKGNLLDKFVKVMIEKKGIKHIWESLEAYKDYIKGRNIENIAGDFYRFVIEEYEKPVKYKGNVPQRDNFEQREYSDEELEKFYANLTEDHE